MTERSKVHFGEQLSAPGELRRAALTSGPGVAWVTIFLLMPLISIVVISFLTRGTYGELEVRFSLESFKRFLGFGAFGFEALYPTILLRSLAMAAGTVTCCVLAALPLAFFICGLREKYRHLALMLLIIPFWTNLLIRTYAWQIVLSGSGWPAQIAAALGLIAPGDALFPSLFAVFIGLTCDYLPLVALPLYASVEKIDWTLAEAASDLGANRPLVFWHTLLPQIKPGLIAGAILVFIAATGQFVIPDLLGGGKTVLLGNAIHQQFGLSRDWPFGSAIACVGIIIVLIGLWVFKRTAGEEGRETLI